MTTVVSFSHASDGYISSENASYSTARSGGAFVVRDDLSSGFIGQAAGFGPGFGVFQSFFRFPYTLDSDSLVASAHFAINILNHGSTAMPRHMEVREFNWGTSLSTADWRTPSQLDALPLLGQVSNINQGTGRSRCGSPALLTRLRTTGEVRVVCLTNRQRNGNTPSTLEWTGLATADISGTTRDPALVYTTVPISDLCGVLGAQVQLSDGTHAFLELDADNFAGADNIKLRHHNGTSAADIATIPVEDLSGSSSVFAHPEQGGSQAMTLVADASDNLYVIGLRNNSTNTLAIRVYIKGVGHSWSPGPLRTWSPPSYPGRINNIAAAWHAEGVGGTIVALIGHQGAANIGTEVAYALLNCDHLLTGSGSLLRASGNAAGLVNGAVNDFNNPINPTGTLLDVTAAPGTTNRGFVGSAALVELGSTGGIYPARYQLAPGGASFADVDRYSVSTDNLAVKDAAGKARVIAIDTSQFVTVTASAGRLFVTHWQNIGTSSTFFRLSTVNLDEEGIESLPAAATLATSQAWDAVYDPETHRVWVYYFDTGDARRLMRTHVDLAAGLAAGDEVEVDDAVGESGSTNHAIRVHRGALKGSQVLISVANETSGGTHSTIYVVDTLNAAPTQPTLTPRPNYDADDNATFEWTFNDPNQGDTQSAYQLQIDEVGGSNVVDTTKTASADEFHQVSGGTLDNGKDYRWRVKTWDAADEESPWSDYGQFTTSASGTVTIVDPDQDNPEGVITGSYLIEWEVDGTTQAAYRVVVVRTDTEAEVVNTGWVASGDTTYEVAGMLSDVEHRVEVTVRNAAEVETNTATRLITPSYGTPERPTVGVSVDDAGGYILVSVSNPEPQGDRPEADRNDILRRVAGSGGAYVKVGEAAPDGSARDYTAASGVVYEYVARAVASDGAYTDSDPAEGGPLTLQGVWIHDPVAPLETVRQFRYGKAQRSSQLDPKGTEQWFAGRTSPVVDYGEHTERRYTVAVDIPEGPDRPAEVGYLQEFVAAKRPVWFRDNRGRVMYARVYGYNESDAGWGSAVQLTFQELDRDVEEVPA